jgi:hypothetical protein
MRSGQHFAPPTNNGTDAHVVESYWMNVNWYITPAIVNDPTDDD